LNSKKQFIGKGSAYLRSPGADSWFHLGLYEKSFSVPRNYF